MVADLSSARAAVLVYGTSLHHTTVASVDLYLELMAGAMQQLAPNTAATQLAKVTVPVMMPLGGPLQCLTVTVKGADVVIKTEAAANPQVCCQAVACTTTNLKVHSDTVSLDQTQNRGLQQLVCMLSGTKCAMQSAAATAVMAWDCSQGFCMPAATTTASAQLQAASSSVAAAMPSAVSCATVTRTGATSPVYITSALTAQIEFNASVLSNTSSTSVAQLQGIKLTVINNLAHAKQTEASSMHMLYQTQGAVTTPLAATQSRPLVVPGRQTQPVEVCAYLMAAAQQASEGQQASLNVTITASHAYEAMTVAMLRSAAQEMYSVSITATTIPAAATSLGLNIASSNIAAMPAVCKLDNGVIYQPTLLPTQFDQLEGSAMRETNSCVVLGGTGSIGSLVGSWLLGNGVREVVLVGRTGKLSEASAANFAQLLARQAAEDDVSMVTIARCDAAMTEEASCLYQQSSSIDRYVTDAML